MLITPMLLCGGSGARLWPLSRKSYSTQFVPLVDEDSLFQASARRLSGHFKRNAGIFLFRAIDILSVFKTYAPTLMAPVQAEDTSIDYAVMEKAILVADKSRSQDVKKAVAVLKAKGSAQATQFPKDHRPWGWFESLAVGDRVQVKRVLVHPGAALSLQSHARHSEHWIVVKGTAKVAVNDEVKLRQLILPVFSGWQRARRGACRKFNFIYRGAPC